VNNRVSKRGLKQFINRQRLAIAHNSPLKDALLILDDCFDHPTALDNDMMRMLYKQGRHLRSSVWCIQQYVVCGLPASAPPRPGAGPAAVGALHDVRHFPVPLPQRPGPEAAVRKLRVRRLPGLRDLQPRPARPGSGPADGVYGFITSVPHTAMVILLNRGRAAAAPERRRRGGGTSGILQSVFWYRPTLITEQVRLCHPALWEHASERTDLDQVWLPEDAAACPTNKLEHLTLLSCCSADER
jgi:hypothetical protein